ncbi:TIGR03435 family protein [Terriglobus roseus]|uniref:Soil-associated protein, TIGR03435 family n=1 Tax=Terriglobus roseus TaxID=392734 RepID=A0A1G7LLB3_9BACT|nr:TIGR03435 family protein [Terriglobus roseus]SDF50144.1 soil-associated protein, TIGR03435 family [Terriglobus roseus]
MRRAVFSQLMWIAFAGSQAFSQSSVLGTSSDYHPTMTFDVASIRESKVGNEIVHTGSSPLHASTFRMQNINLSNLVTLAYGVQYYQLSGAPSWDFETLYTVEAKSDDAADAKLAHLSDHDARLEKQHMLQVLLADRFHLQVHWESRQIPVYDLVISKPGLLKETSDDSPQINGANGKAYPPLYQRGSSMTGFELVGHGATMAMLCDTLNSQFGRPVVNQTGLSGKYDFVLPYLGRFDADRKSDDTNPVPTLDHSLQEKLGLRVKASRGDIPVVVIDQVDQHPPEN